MAPLPILPIALPTPFRIGPIHVYVIKADPVTLVDAGLHGPDSRAALLEGLRAGGLGLTDIRRVLLTHAHHDHVGLVAWIVEETGAEVWIHPDEQGKLQTPKWWLSQRDRILTEAGVPAEVQSAMNQVWLQMPRMLLPRSSYKPLADGQRFSFECGMLEAIHLPGHALGHTGFWDESGSTLIGGDHLLSGVTPNPIMEPVPPGHPAAVPHAPIRALTLSQFLDSLRRVAAMPILRVLPGHGPTFTDHIQVATGYVRRHERRLTSLQSRLEDGMTAHELTCSVYPKVREFDIFLALSEVLAHLDLLVVQGRAAVKQKELSQQFCAI